MPSVKEAAELAARIKDMVEEEVSPDTREENSDFFDSVLMKSAAILETCRRTHRVSDKQMAALENMAEAVGKWVHD